MNPNNHGKAVTLPGNVNANGIANAHGNGNAHPATLGAPPPANAAHAANAPPPTINAAPPTINAPANADANAAAANAPAHAANAPPPTINAAPPTINAAAANADANAANADANAAANAAANADAKDKANDADDAAANADAKDKANDADDADDDADDGNPLPPPNYPPPNPNGSPPNPNGSPPNPNGSPLDPKGTPPNPNPKGIPPNPNPPRNPTPPRSTGDTPRNTDPDPPLDTPLDTDSSDKKVIAGANIVNGIAEEICKSINKTIIFFIFCIIIIILIVSIFILAINIINYMLFTIYCINDNISDYTAEDPTEIITGSKYKFRLLNYVTNLNYNTILYSDNIYISNNKYDSLSSDLYIHKTITAYNYIVKLLLLIIMIILIATIYNIFNILIIYITDCRPLINCEFIQSDIYNNNTHIYYIIIVIAIYICAHSYIYTYGFNKNIYKDIYDLYDGESQYKSTDIIVYNAINMINNSDTRTQTGLKPEISLYLNDLKNFSYENLSFHNFLNTTDNTMFEDLVNNGIIANNKFIIPTVLESEENTNNLLKNIYNIDHTIGNSVGEKDQELLANKIFLYLIYHYVIAHNKEDPFIIHKLNNIYLNTFENLYTKYKNTEEVNFSLRRKEEEDKNKDPKNEPVVDSNKKIPTYVPIDRNELLDKFNGEIKFMYNEIKSSYTTKLLLPVNTKKQVILNRLEDNADLILKYIFIYNKNIDISKSIAEGTTTTNWGNLNEGKLKDFTTPLTKEEIQAGKEKFHHLKKSLKERINDFAGTFSDFAQEDKTLGYINRIVYKINFYLAVEMLITIIFILIVLLILYKSNKYPYLEKFINIAIAYAILIINEVISAILGIV